MTPSSPPSDFDAQAHALLQRQARAWPLLGANVEGFKNIRTRALELENFSVRLQFNPARVASALAKVDPAAIRERKCFLCPAHLPAEQEELPFQDDYLVLCNPFPIFPEHFTIVHRAHRPQAIADTFDAMLALAEAMAGRYTIFYNGPRCGASAPDHLHFQAGNRGFMPIETQLDPLTGEPPTAADGVTARAVPALRPFFVLGGADRGAIGAAFAHLYRALDETADATSRGEEPMMNVLAWFDAAAWRVIVFPRARHRPSFFFAEGDARILLSPGSVDLGGVCILPVERDFDRLTADHLRTMFREVMLPPEAFGQVARRLRQLRG